MSEVERKLSQENLGWSQKPLKTAKPSNIIIGSGALGTFLAADLSVNESIGLVNKTPVCFPITIHTSGTQQNFDSKKMNSLTLSKACQANFFSECSTIFICVPPSATVEICKVLRNSQLHPSVTLFFCGNGLVLDTEAILEKHPGVRICRALFHAGFRREVDSSGTDIFHTGGTRVEWGTIHGAIPEAPQTKILHWEFKNNIRQLEIEKFFTNLILASVIGSRILPNEDLWKFITQLELMNLATAFHQAINHEVSQEKQSESEDAIAKAFVSALMHTVADTKQNINSISSARHAGNSAPWHALLEQLQQLLAASRNTKARNWFWKFVTSEKEKN